MSLREKIESREAVVAVVGLGYVGLPLALSFCEAGFRVIGIDVDRSRVESISRGDSYVRDVCSEFLSRHTEGVELFSTDSIPAGKLKATTDYNVLGYADAVIISVPTPLSKTKEPDMSHIIAATEEISLRLRKGMIIVLESTTYPGTTEELILPRLASNSPGHLEVGKDFFLAFSPERIDPGSTNWTVRNTPKVIGGVTDQCLEMAQALYQGVADTLVPVSSAKAAEMTKLLENTFRAVNIGLVNELAMICDRLGVDVWEVIDAANTKPFGFMPFYPGPGLGGHCIPIDPQYLAWKMKTLDFDARFIQLASEINYGMPQYVLNKILYALNEVGKPLKGSKLLIVGVAYKADVADTRESPSLDLITLLQRKGALVNYHDPHVAVLDVEGVHYESVSLSEENLRGADCVVIMVAHRLCDWQAIARHSTLIMDTRNATKDMDGAARIVKL